MTDKEFAALCFAIITGAALTWLFTHGAHSTRQVPAVTCARLAYPWELVSYRLDWNGNEWDCHYVKHWVR